MKSIYIGIVCLVLMGCSPLVHKGDYVTYTSGDYVFIKNSFIDQSIDCIELGKMKQGGMAAKYCVGVNYASQLVQGFIFEHHYDNVNERFIGATLSFKTKNTFTIQCSSETIDGESSGREYINCMVPRTSFDLYAFIVNSNRDVHGRFKAAVGDIRVYNDAIDAQGKALLHQFYKERVENNKKEWKKRTL